MNKTLYLFLISLILILTGCGGGGGGSSEVTPEDLGTSPTQQSLTVEDLTGDNTPNMVELGKLSPSENDNNAVIEFNGTLTFAETEMVTQISDSRRLREGRKIFPAFSIELVLRWQSDPCTERYDLDLATGQQLLGRFHWCGQDLGTNRRPGLAKSLLTGQSFIPVCRSGDR